MESVQVVDLVTFMGKMRAYVVLSIAKERTYVLYLF